MVQFVSVLGLCAKAGMVRPGIVAIDGTNLAPNASQAKNVSGLLRLRETPLHLLLLAGTERPPLARPCR